MQKTNPTNGQFHNPGYEYLKLIYLMKDSQVYDSSQGTSVHFLPLLALQSARLAIDGYVDQVGRQIDPAWDKSDHVTASIKERIARIYKKTGKPVDFKRGVWKGVLTLFEMTELIHTNPAELSMLASQKSLRFIERSRLNIPSISRWQLRKKPLKHCWNNALDG